MEHGLGQFGYAMARRASRLVSVAAIGLAILVAAQPVAAQDSANLARQVDRLRRELADLQRYVYKGGQPPASIGTDEQAAQPEVAGRMQVQITQMQEQMRDLTGRLEEVQHRIMVLEDRLNRMSEDLEVRLLTIEDALAKGSATAPAGASPEAATGEELATQEGEREVATTRNAGTVELPEGTPREQYDFAYSLLKNHQWSEGRSALQTFVEKHPDDELADNAAYWIGETYYINKQYKDAAKAFLEGYRKYPKADKAPDNLLKLAKSLAALDQIDNACTTYGKLLEDYPNSLPRIIKLAKSERKKLNCK